MVLGLSVVLGCASRKHIAACEAKYSSFSTSPFGLLHLPVDHTLHCPRALPELQLSAKHVKVSETCCDILH